MPMNQDCIESFNEKLKEIRILELIAIGFLSVFLLGLLELDIFWIIFIPIIYVLFRTRNQLNGLKCCATNLFSKISLRTWLLLGIAGYVSALGLGIISDEMFPSQYFILNSIQITGSGLILIGADFLFSVILGPVCEELIFRGILLNRFNNRMPLILSVFLTSLLFALFHPDTAQISSFIFGVTMCIAYLISSNILIPISLHMFNNLLSIGVSHIPNLEIILASQTGMILLVLLTIISLAYIFKFIWCGYREIKTSN